MAQEGEETAEDNSLGRLLTLSDGVFAIAMTLLALDLKVPDLGSHVSDPQLLHALAHNTASYWSYLLTFYIIATYWGRHRRLMRSVVTTHPTLSRYDLADHAANAPTIYSRQWQSRLTLPVFLLCIPAGYLFGHNGPYVLLLLVVPSRLAMLNNVAHHYQYHLNTLRGRFKARSRRT
ncbi:MAG: TMEM175 family protein [Actinomycetota bacterium]|nr:TMEM175 family protein [Actinomycetota bacterium]